MEFSKIVAGAAAIGLFGVAIAQDQTRVQIEVISDDGDHEAVRLELDSDDMGFNLHDMQEGENRSIVDKDGRTILVTRNADGYSFDVDGKTIDMPLVASGHHGVVIADAEHGENVDVRVMKHGKVAAPVHMDGTMIMTGKPVDEATQQAIRSLLESAGHEGEVRFMDRERMHEGHQQVRVIEKRVEISE
jgi:hypothetical protein